jgi:predicted nucleic acid-binding protein
LRFWDSSAIVPLLVGEATTEAMQAIALEDPAMLVWWTTEVECASAIARLERQDDLSSDATLAAHKRVDAFGGSMLLCAAAAGAALAAAILLVPRTVAGR